MNRTILNRIVFIVTLLVSGIVNVAPASARTDLTDPRKVSRESLTEALAESVISGRTEELEKTIRLYPENFRNIDLPGAYLDAGMKYYRMKTKMIALKLFMKGYDLYSELPSKQQCGFYIAKILYQQDRRDSALFYINRVIGNLGPGDPLRDESLRLKRRIRWEYLSRYEGLPDDSISKIEFDGDDLWLGMWTGGAARYTRSGNSIRIFRQASGGLVSRHVRDIRVFRNRVYVATFAGLCYYDKKRSQWVREKGLIGKVTVKKLKTIGGELYAATLDQGLYRFNDGRNAWEKYFTGARNVMDILERDGKIYIASLDRGLFVRENGRFRSLIPDMRFKSLGMIGNELWAGTHGNGIAVLDADDRLIRQYREADGLSSDFVETMEAVSNRMVIGTLGGGVSVFRPAPDGSGTFSKLSVTGGLPSDDVVRISFEKNKVWFGTLSGGVGILLTENFEDI